MQGRVKFTSIIFYIVSFFKRKVRVLGIKGALSPLLINIEAERDKKFIMDCYFIKASFG